MKMVDMKRSKEEPKPDYMGKSVESEYPYGLMLCLCEDDIKKLGMDLPAVDSEMMIMAKVKVCSVSQSESLYGKNRSMNLQIVEMGIGSEKE